MMDFLEHGHQITEDETPLVEEVNPSWLSPNLVQPICDAASEHNKDTNKSCSTTCPLETTHVIGSKQLVIDLNTVEVSSTVEYNPFFQYKKLGQVNPEDPSECGSTTAPLDEDEPLEKWNRMKENRLLSSSHGGIPLPKKHARQSRNRKDDKFKMKAEPSKKEQANKFAKLAASTSLLPQLDPRIVNHVRNGKQVVTITEAMMQSEKDHRREEGKESNDRRKVQNFSLSSTSGPGLVMKHNETSVVASHLRSKYGNHALALSFSSDDASNISSNETSLNQESIASLSLKASTVACQWLQLLVLDTTERLAALRHSRKRVLNVIHTELPYLLSKELPSNRGSNPSSDSCGFESETSNNHAARWKSLFSQMDGTLYEEAKKLESWLRQVQEMQVHCETAQKFITSNASSHPGSPEYSRRSEKPNEMKCVVMATAASIYSTSNFIMTKESSYDPQK